MVVVASREDAAGWAVVVALRLVVVAVVQCVRSASVRGSKMLCQNPFNLGSHLAPCGRCEPCLQQRSRTWAHRIILEAAQQKDNAFLTLTYSDENLPLTTNGLQTLEPKDLQNWLKRFRKAVAPTRIRFYGVGEYGDLTWRPHYHVAVFGFPACARGNTSYTSRRLTCCASCDAVSDTWGLGKIYSGTLEVSSASYIAGYVVKKMTRNDDPRLDGRHPEFARMSNRPGIGADAMHEVASVFMQFNLDESEADVPSALRHGSRTLPLGRYLRRRLRSLIGRDQNAPQEILDQRAAEMLPLRIAAKTSVTSPSLKRQVLEVNQGRYAQMMARSKIRKQRKDKL